MVSPLTAPNNPRVTGVKVPVANVEIGEIPDDDDNAKYADDGDDIGIYTDYQVRSEFCKPRHVYGLPLASPNGFQGQSCAFVQLAAPTLVWICDWTVAKFNEQPNIPDPNSVDADWVLMDERLEPADITVAPNGETPLYRISGTYVYGKRAPENVLVKDIAFPRPPWLLNTFDRTMPQNKLTTGLISAGDGMFLQEVL